MEFDSHGQPSFRTFISFGNSQKYYSMLEKMNISPKRVRQSIEDNIIALYDNHIDENLTELLLSNKLCNPNLAETLDFSNDAKLHASSVYVLQNKVVLVSEGEQPSRDYLSMIELVSELKKSKANNTEYKWLFPMTDVYELIIREIDSHTKTNIKVSTNRRSVSTRISFSTIATRTPVSLLNVVRRKWFKIMSVQGSSYSHNAAWAWYKERKGLSWLSETMEETIEKSSPLFSDKVSLFNYISSLSESTKVVRSYSPIESCASDKESIVSMIRFSQWHGRVLSSDRESLNESRQFELHKVVEKIWRLSCLPDVFAREEIIREILVTCPDFLMEHDIRTTHYEMTKNQIALGTLINYAKASKSTFREKEVLCKFIESMNLGIVGTFEIRQRYDSKLGGYAGHGVYRGKFDGIKCEIDVTDYNLNYILIEDLNKSMMGFNTIKQFIIEQKWHANSQESKTGLFYDIKKNIIVERGGKFRVEVITRK
jgi:hypothetical protein